MTKPKVFECALHLRVPSALKDRIDALRGQRRQGDFIREILAEIVEQKEDMEFQAVPPARRVEGSREECLRLWEDNERLRSVLRKIHGASGAVLLSGDPASAGSAAR